MSVAQQSQQTGQGSAAMLPAIKLSSGAIESLKWLAVGLMTLDHVNKYLFSASIPFAFELGRIAMPLFAFLLAYNLSRQACLARGSYQRSMKRLALTGVLSTPIAIGLGGLLWGIWPLNIMFMLLTAAAVMFLVDRGRAGDKSTAVFIFIVGGAFVEFWWPAVGFALASWFYCRRPGWVSLIAAISCLILLLPINSNLWALAAIPVIFACAKINLRCPRSKWYVFYAYYPLHLLAILLCKAALA